MKRILTALIAATLFGNANADLEPVETRFVEPATLSVSNLDFALAPINSAEKLDLFLSLGVLDETPFAKLTPQAQERFIDGLRFGKTGLSSLYFGDLEKELTASENYQLLRLFGAQAMASSLDGAQIRTAADLAVIATKNDGDKVGFLMGYYCQAAGTCYEETRSACTGNC